MGSFSFHFSFSFIPFFSYFIGMFLERVPPSELVTATWKYGNPLNYPVKPSVTDAQSANRDQRPTRRLGWPLVVDCEVNWNLTGGDPTGQESAAAVGRVLERGQRRPSAHHRLHGPLPHRHGLAVALRRDDPQVRPQLVLCPDPHEGLPAGHLRLLPGTLSFFFFFTEMPAKAAKKTPSLVGWTTVNERTGSAVQLGEGVLPDAVRRHQTLRRWRPLHSRRWYLDRNGWQHSQVNAHLNPGIPS